MDVAALKALRDRVAQASGPDREIDAAIRRLDDPEFCIRGEGGYSAWRGNLCLGASLHLLPAYTVSIDAAVSLVETKLPGQACAIGTMAFRDETRKPWATIWKTDGTPAFNAEGVTPALALICAFLEALISQAPPASHGEDKP